MIPKIIHYCWFGNKQKPHNVKRCIQSWKKLMPDYRFIEWNESNFDVRANSYTYKAYKDKKYAFVSDVARLSALYKYGGVYLDTDVIAFKKFDTILNHRCVLGFEEKLYIATSFIACEAQHPFIKHFLDYYNNAEYGDFKTNVVVVTEFLEALGLKRQNTFQTLKEGIVVYPQDYFSPYDYINCKMNRTKKSICAHLFYISWANSKQRMIRTIKSAYSFLFGSESLEKMRNRR